MRGRDEERERAFFDIFQPYLDLEANTSRKYEIGEYSLDLMMPLASLVGHPQDKLRIAHVAGTKGKGSTSIYLTALLQSAGVSCGTFTSPHLATVRERFLINGQSVDYGTLNPASKKLEAVARQAGMKPTFFEFMTDLALHLFAEAGLEFAVLETGIGGLLDSTNFIPAPVITIITPISFDHTQLLGTTIPEIAAQKAGIIKPDIPVLCARQPFPAAVDVIRKVAARVGAPFARVDDNIDISAWLAGDTPPFQTDNFRTALQGCRTLGIEPDPARFVPPLLRARCECIHRDPMVILDVAHNADSARRLVEALHLLYPGERFTVVLGVVAGKDVVGIFEGVLPIVESLILTNPRTPRGSELARLIDLSDQAAVPYTVVPDIQSRGDLPTHQSLLFTGSFFTALIGEEMFAPPA